jgi:DNA-binding NarL/FixJ family response regulator
MGSGAEQGVGALGKLRVLVAEDHHVIRTFVATLLKEEFDVVGAVGDGEQLLEAARASLPDVIVSDIEMPGMDGLMAREELLSNGIQIPFVFITLLDMARLLAHHDRHPAGYVHKMDIINELNSGVHAVANGRSYLSRSFKRNPKDKTP